MARIYADDTERIVGIRLNQDEIEKYGEPEHVHVLEFDPETNPTILPAISLNHNGHQCNSTRLALDGVAYTIAAPGEADDLRRTATTIIQGLQDYRNLPSPNNAQTVAAVKAIARVVIYFLRSLR